MDMSCFDMTGIELVKKKYYNAAKVTELLEGIRSACEKLERENAGLKERLEAISAQKEQIGDTLMSARDIARQLVDDARLQAAETAKLAQSQAEETVKAAEKKAELILAGARAGKDASDADVSEVQEYALRCVENCVDKLRAQHMEAIELLNAQWQEFLSGLILPGDEKPHTDMPAGKKPEPAAFSFAPAAESALDIRAAAAKPFSLSAAAEAAPQKAAQPVDWMALASMEMPDLEEQYADIDADTFFSGGFFAEQTGNGIFEELKSMMDSIGNHEE